MRIVSQDGFNDIPYSNTRLEYKTKLFRSVNITIADKSSHEIFGGTMFLGNYKTKDRALEVMSDIRTRYEQIVDEDYNTRLYFYMPKE
jgi:hypothetical protein